MTYEVRITGSDLSGWWVLDVVDDAPISQHDYRSQAERTTTGLCPCCASMVSQHSDLDKPWRRVECDACEAGDHDELCDEEGDR